MIFQNFGWFRLPEYQISGLLVPQVPILLLKKKYNNFLPILASKRRFSSLIRDPLPAWELISSCKSSRSASAALLARSAELRSCFKRKKRYMKYFKKKISVKSIFHVLTSCIWMRSDSHVLTFFSNSLYCWMASDLLKWASSESLWSSLSAAIWVKLSKIE